MSFTEQELKMACTEIKYKTVKFLSEEATDAIIQQVAEDQIRYGSSFRTALDIESEIMDAWLQYGNERSDIFKYEKLAFEYNIEMMNKEIREEQDMEIRRAIDESNRSREEYAMDEFEKDSEHYAGMDDFMTDDAEEAEKLIYCEERDNEIHKALEVLGVSRAFMEYQENH